MNAERLEFFSRFEDGGYKHYLVNRWPQKIVVSTALLSCKNTLSEVEGNTVRFSLANGSAVYRQTKAGDIFWEGALQPGCTYRAVA